MTASEQGRSLLFMAVMAVLVGVIAGVGAWAFRMLIGLIHNLLFLGQFAFEYDANLHTDPSPWGMGVILVPVVGAMIVAFLVKTFCPEAKGHGVPEVMDAIYYKDAKIRPLVAVIKSLASGTSIGSGGSVGREGPIIQIGAAFGATLGQWVPMPARQRAILIAVGAGGGIAATFNSPLGGIAFAMELLLVSVSAPSLLLVGLGTVTATHISRMLLGRMPAFDIPFLAIPDLHVAEPYALLVFIPFGLLIGVAAWAFVRWIYWAEDVFDAMPGNYYTRHGLGMLLVGIIIWAFQEWAGHYYVQGVGYATIQDVLEGTLGDPAFLLLLFAAKMLVTLLTLGSGASGGVFSPSLFMGATLGAAFGIGVQAVIPGFSVGPAAFAMAGMAGMVGGGTGAVLTAAVMTFEMTLDYNAILPILITVVLAYAVRKALSRESIYTLKLVRRGHVVPEGLQAAMIAAHRVGEVMSGDFRVVDAGHGAGHFAGVTVLSRDGGIAGVLEQIQTDVQDFTVLPQAPFVLAGRSEALEDVLRRMGDREAQIALICDRPDRGRAEDVVGVVTRTQIAHLTQKVAKLL